MILISVARTRPLITPRLVDTKRLCRNTLFSASNNIEASRKCRKSLHQPLSFSASRSIYSSPSRFASFSADPLHDATESSKVFYSPDQKKVMDRCKALHASIMPLNAKVSSRCSRNKQLSKLSCLVAPTICIKPVFFESCLIYSISLALSGSFHFHRLTLLGISAHLNWNP